MAVKEQKPLDLESYVYSIYHITSPLSKSTGYIGITKLDVNKRLDKHFSHAYEDSANFAAGKIHRVRTVLKALLKYDRENIEIRKIDECIGLSQACALEVKYIQLYDTFKSGWNETIGGEGQPSYTPDAKTRQKISDANKGRVRSEEAVLANRERAKNRYTNGFRISINQKRNKVPVTIDNIKFESIKEAINYYNVSYSKIREYIEKGTSCVENDRKVVIYGIEYSSKSEAYKALGWHKQNYYNYLIYGQPKVVKGVPLYVNGVKYDSLSDIQKAYNCGKVKAMSLATGEDIRENIPAREVEMGGVKFDTVKLAAEYWGVSKTSVYTYINTGTNDTVFAKYEYKGLYFSNLNAFKRITGLTSWFYREFIKSGEIINVSDKLIRFDVMSGKRLVKTDEGWVKSEH